jgi:hypothetical protein
MGAMPRHSAGGHHLLLWVLAGVAAAIGLGAAIWALTAIAG